MPKPEMMPRAASFTCRAPPSPRNWRVASTMPSRPAEPPAWPVDNAVTYLREQSGKHFDPRLTTLFLELLPEIAKIRAEFPDRPAAMFDLRTRMSETLV